jgi:diadenosine tetraphosphatase ApaH/serine/threonine PP2A family protein phosphatase
LKTGKRMAIFIGTKGQSSASLLTFSHNASRIRVRLAIISDIHSNLQALTRVFELIDDQSVDQIVCLGDMVGYGGNPNECVQLIRERCGIILRGNHDAAAIDSSVADSFTKNARIAATWTRGQLEEENRAFLETLPLTANLDGALFVHASPYEPGSWYYVLSEEEVEAAFRSFSESICFIGHSHFPGIFSEDGPVRSVTKESRYLVNVGSVGQPRDGDPRLSYGIFDSDSWTYRNFRGEYDIEGASQKILTAGLPRALAERLFLGR